MKQLIESKAGIELFADDPEVQKIINAINELVSLTGKPAAAKAETLRNNLRVMSQNENYISKKIEGQLLIDAIYNIQVALTELFPINTNDPILQDEFPIESIKVSVSTGYVYDLETLLTYHKTRAYRGSELGESDKSKWLLDPINNLPFSLRDVARIKAAAVLNRKSIEHLQTLETAFQEGSQIINAHDGDFYRGEKLLVISAKAGHADAAAQLAEVYFDDFATINTFRMGGPAWRGKKQDYELGLHYLKLAIALGSQKAKGMMCGFLFDGQTELKIEKDEAKANELLNELIKEGNLEAILGKIQLLIAGVSERTSPDSQIDDEFVKYLDSFSDDSFEERLNKAIEYAEKGSLKALDGLVQLYTEGDPTASIPPDPVKKAYYQEKRDQEKERRNINFNEILLLLEKASDLGDADSSIKLALLNLGDKNVIHDYEKPVNIAEALNYLQLSSSQGSFDAVLILSALYLKKSNVLVPGVSLYSYNLDNIPFNPKRALIILLQAYPKFQDGYQKGKLAHEIATLYYQYADWLPAEERVANMKQQFEIAVAGENPDAIIEYGLLLLKGDTTLGINGDHEKADKVFHKIPEGYSYKISDALVPFIHESDESLSRFLYWKFTELLNDDSSNHDDRKRNIMQLSYLLKTGSLDYAQKKHGELLKKNETIVAACARILTMGFFTVNRWDEKNLPQNAYPEEKVKEMMHMIYDHYNLTCPFKEAVRTNSVSLQIPNASGGILTITTSSGRRAHPCLLFSEKTYREIPENEAAITSPHLG